MTLRSKRCVQIGCIIIAAFFAVQTGIVFGLLEPSYEWALFGYLCVILFIPLFACFTGEFILIYREKKQQLTDKYDAILQSNLIVIFDNKGIILEVNDLFCEAMGYTKDELVGQSHKQFVPRDFAKSADYRAFWAMLRQGNYIRSEFKRIRKDGSEVWISGTYTPIKAAGGSVQKVLKIATDVTDTHKAQLELSKKNKYLEHAAKILRHDMHSGINTYMPRGLRSLERRLSPEKIKELKIEAPLKLIKEGLQHTQRVYAGVKEFTNLVKENTQLNKQLCRLDSILRNYLSQTAYNDQVAIDWLPEIEVNEPLFCTAIDNFIRNGLKYNDSEFKMVAILMLDNEHLGVMDNGRGMTQEDFDKLSQPYQRRDSQVESGSGLGLNISVAILDEHCFPVSCMLNPDGGTIIKVKIK
jgi:PAS domain S-box-containing protein